MKERKTWSRRSQITVPLTPKAVNTLLKLKYLQTNTIGMQDSTLGLKHRANTEGGKCTLLMLLHLKKHTHNPFVNFHTAGLQRKQRNCIPRQMCSIGPTSTNPKNVITAVCFTSSFPSFSITNCHTKKHLDAKILLKKKQRVFPSTFTWPGLLLHILIHKNQKQENQIKCCLDHLTSANTCNHHIVEYYIMLLKLVVLPGASRSSAVQASKGKQSSQCILQSTTQLIGALGKRCTHPRVAIV
jgi:hypothetical protein